ncbi:MAG: 1-acyl-sn-glycerol-3-phosphate acyltransferase [Pseudomonadales bacterium]
MFDDIRPYNDDEVEGVLQNLVKDPELLSSIQQFRYPGWPAWSGFLLRPLIRRHLSQQTKDVHSVHDFQMIVKQYVRHMIEQTMDGFSVSGAENILPDQACLFLGNHRDITLDPAFTNFALHQHDFDTVRIAIGDNLLTKPFATDLMRLNKSFIVKRSASGPRQILAAFKNLSAYILQSIRQDGQYIWMAQREGRAKDGNDKTEPAIIKMLAMSRDKKIHSFAEHIRQLNIIPVAVSYEYDPCDLAKATELAAIAEHGSYDKAEHEDIRSIADGISGYKGQVHIAFGERLTGNFETPEDVAAEVDRQIYRNYRLHPSNCVAWERLNGSQPTVRCGSHDQAYDPAAFAAEISTFVQRLQAYPAALQPAVLAMYAKPVSNKLARAS